MQYRTIFDLAQSGYQWNDLDTGLVFIIIGVATTGLRLYLRDKTVRLRHRIAESVRPGLVTFLRPVIGLYLFISTYFFLTFAVLWTIALFSVTYYRYIRFRDALDSGKAVVMEGPVKVFQPANDGRRLESFMIGNEKIQYSDGVMNGGFNTTHREGGPIREDLPVRLWCVNGVIVRLDVGPSVPEPKPSR
jgi:hypothetical protein